MHGLLRWLSAVGMWSDSVGLVLDRRR